MKKLYPSFTTSSNYRGLTQNRSKMSVSESESLRTTILKRDKNTCSYCGFHADEWQSIHFVDGDSTNNQRSNLTTVCPMCILILNTLLGCQIEGIVQLYEKSKYDQNKIVQITRKMRSEGKKDDEIKKFLGLKDLVPFKRDREYLKRLYAFVTSWKGSYGQFETALAYGYSQ